MLLTFNEAHDKINVPKAAKAQFWSHYRNHIGNHPAIDQHDANPQSEWHQPTGIAGDDARYTLSGRKIIVMMVSSVLQKVESTLMFVIVFFVGGCSNPNLCCSGFCCNHALFPNQDWTLLGFLSLCYGTKSHWGPGL